MKNPTLLLSAFALSLAACEKAPPSAPPSAPPPVVKVVAVAESFADGQRSYSGEVRARREMPLAFRIGGKLIERRVDAGARVGPGQTLARLDPADAALQASQAQAQEALAAAEARRTRDLHAKNFISGAALDAKETALAAARAQAGLTKNQVAYAALAADHAGVIAAVLAEPGQVVAAGQPVLRLARDGEREAAIALPETALAGLKVGAAAEIALWSGGRTYRGRLRELSPAADPATRTYAARVTMIETGPEVVLGMTATVRFAGGSPALTVPLPAVFQQGEKHAVWIVGADGALALRPIVLGAYTEAGATVVEGLAAGERIVAAGVHKLVAGQKVRVAQ
ncbi:MAG: efflux RND transporter periplasmic adaptor subunit [Candidatus Nitricoxidivorans perseverans]|uniref:Efflux RND transporter periplasmic adaptor subunit n=1 Tax=Candidatus Nitricoxidivorans perseverans TaxID=2975601 RepID=A0AA49IRN8_9PROT|nr:MAG: efflux RND transporter periplasmic adaptor subunit [Candidatus Nitricoxidivorans perseverans]